MANNSNEEVLNTLADMNEAIGNQFEKVSGEIGEVRSDVNRLETSMKKQFIEVNSKLSSMDERLERIEHTILEDHARRIEALERKAAATG